MPGRHDPFAGSRRSRYDPPEPIEEAGDVRDDFDDEFAAARSPREIARRRVAVPAIAFIVIGILGVLGMLAVSVGVILEQMRQLQRYSRGGVLGMMFFLLCLTAIGTSIFALMIYSGNCFRTLRKRRLVFITSYIVTGLSIGGCYTAPIYVFGIWALILLHQPSIRSEFDKPLEAVED